MYHGIINVYKEAGWTSHDVVSKLRGILKQKKIGHTGTLDPDAVGVLPVCLGSGTKLCGMLTDKNKEYIAKLLLGITTDTQDITGVILTRQDVNVGEEAVKEAILSFEGIYHQIPPMYSALKVNGKKLYELAREGKEIERKPREVHIGHIEIISLKLPEAEIKVSCSKGTYIRTLMFDIGEKLGCGGTMASLIRTRAGSFKIEDAYTLDQIQELVDTDRTAQAIKPVDWIFQEYPAVTVQEQYQKLLRNGNRISEQQTAGMQEIQKGIQVRMYSSDGLFYGIYEYDYSQQYFTPVKMFITES